MTKICKEKLKRQTRPNIVKTIKVIRISFDVTGRQCYIYIYIYTAYSLNT